MSLDDFKASLQGAWILAYRHALKSPVLEGVSQEKI